MSGKGSGRRPAEVSEQAFADNWSRIFGNSQMGTSSTGRASGSNPDSVGSTPTSPATIQFYEDPVTTLLGLLSGAYDVYLDDATGKQVSEDWWPGDAVSDAVAEATWQEYMDQEYGHD